MSGEGCGLNLFEVLRDRPRLLVVLLLLVVLQGLFLVYSSSFASPAVVCRGSDCAPAAVTVLHTANRPDRQAPVQFNRTLLRPDSWQQLVSALFDYIEKPHARCEKAVRVGGQPDYKNKKFDGFKWVCLDPQFGLLQTNRCLIYSFGVDHDWSFDDNVQRLQCEIHAFDPSIGKKDHRRSPLITFHNMGIGGRTEVRKVQGRLWDIRTYDSIVASLKHQNRTVHYLKVDVEGAEWEMFAQIFSESPHLLRNVRQIGMEVHMAYGPQNRLAGLDKWKGYLATFQQLEAMGFRLFYAEMNPYTRPEKLFPSLSRRASRVYEMAWLYRP